ncbi:hypothetical protein CO683_00640 [Bradyrhizobium ottawaense]|nr:hypothetical protein CO683_00640 [Bradyrhizobium ottawaense]
MFSDRELAEDHFGIMSILPPACVAPLRGDEKAMNHRAMEYERRWRQALKERDCALAEVDDHNLALLKIAGAISQLQLAEESTSDDVTRRHLREIYADLQQVGQS